MRSEAKTVEEYLEELPEDRRAAISAVRDTILASLPDGYQEGMGFGMVSYTVPLEVYPKTYNKLPLMYAAIGSQKNHMAVYLSGIYADDDARARFEAAYKATGKRYDVGKSCVRFRKIDDLPLEVIGDAVGAIDLEDFIGQYEAARERSRGKSG